MVGPYRTPKNYAVMAYEQGWTTPAYFCESVQYRSCQHTVLLLSVWTDIDKCLVIRCILPDN